MISNDDYRRGVSLCQGQKNRKKPWKKLVAGRNEGVGHRYENVVMKIQGQSGRDGQT